MSKIKEAFSRICEGDVLFRRSIAGKTQMPKTAVSRILRFVDSRNGASKKTTHFSKLYLEKWKSVSAALLEKPPKDVIPLNWEENAIKILARLNILSNAWDDMKKIPEYVKALEETSNSKMRKNFPNINYFVNKIAKMLDIDLPHGEFPMPKTEKCVNKLKRYEKLILFRANMKKTTDESKNIKDMLSHA